LEIAGFVKLSAIDFPGKLSCVVFVQGCNLRCIYCHNIHLIPFKKGRIPSESIISYISENREFLDGIVVTGGEPLTQKDICDFLEKVKRLGMSVKIDTNGFFPEELRRLIQLGLVDYVAMDVKAPLTPEEYSFIAGRKICEKDIDRLRRTISLLSRERVSGEFRTTIIESYHTLERVERIVNELPPNATYVLQQFVSRDYLRIKEGTTSKEYILKLVESLREKYGAGLRIEPRIYE